MFSAVAIALVATAVLFVSVASAAGGITASVTPLTKTIKAGETTSFTALVQGNVGVPFYRWYVNDVAQPQYTSAVIYISEAEPGTYKIWVHVESGGAFYDTAKSTLTVTAGPTQAPTAAPTQAPTAAPTQAPTEAPTQAPTQAPTAAPTQAPTAAPTSTESGGFSLTTTAVYAIVIIVVIAVIGVAAFAMLRKKK